MAVKPAQIELLIDELMIDERVIGKLPPRARQALHAEVERELTRLLSAGDLPPQLRQSGQVEEVDGGRIARGHTNHTAGAEPLGAQIAQSVYRSLGQ